VRSAGRCAICRFRQVRHGGESLPALVVAINVTGYRFAMDVRRRLALEGAKPFSVHPGRILTGSAALYRARRGGFPSRVYTRAHTGGHAKTRCYRCYGVTNR